MKIALPFLLVSSLAAQRPIPLPGTTGPIYVPGGQVVGFDVLNPCAERVRVSLTATGAAELRIEFVGAFGDVVAVADPIRMDQVVVLPAHGGPFHIRATNTSTFPAMFAIRLAKA